MENTISENVWRSFNRTNSDKLMIKRTVATGKSGHRFLRSHFANMILSGIFCILE
jgi:hypothetical protein